MRKMHARVLGGMIVFLCAIGVSVVNAQGISSDDARDKQLRKEQHKEHKVMLRERFHDADKTKSKIEMPGTKDNNKQINQALSTLSSELDLMKNNLLKSSYESHRTKADAALKSLVDGYFVSRIASGDPVGFDYQSDPFIRDVISMKQALNKKNLTVADITNVISTLSDAKSLLLTLKA